MYRPFKPRFPGRGMFAASVSVAAAAQATAGNIPLRLARMRNSAILLRKVDEPDGEHEKLHEHGHGGLNNCDGDTQCKECEAKMGEDDLKNCNGDILCSECKARASLPIPEGPLANSNRMVSVVVTELPGDKFQNDARFKLPEDGWIHVAPHGEHPHPQGVVQVLDDESFNSMVANFKTRKASDEVFPGILIDIDHFSDTPGERSEAAAWIEDLEHRDSGLWAKPRWTDMGEKVTGSGEYRLVSPTWNRSDCEQLSKDRVRPMVLDTVALTNNPNLKGLTPLTT
jgi:hypothetical protein